MAYTNLNTRYKVKVDVARFNGQYSFESMISFAHDPEDYGSGYYMYIKSKEEPFGGQSYDLRYIKEFHANSILEFIVMFYSQRYDGAKTDYDTKWKLTGISITEERNEE